ncbi:MAG: AraC family transcriptional regulator [Pseudomonadota bacterium]
MSTTHVVMDNQEPVPACSSVPDEIKLEGLRLLVLPPGKVNAWVRAEAHSVDVNLNLGKFRVGLNSDRLREFLGTPDTAIFFPRGTEIRLQAENTTPGLVLEVCDTTLSEWLQGAEIGAVPEAVDRYHHDRTTGELGRLAIRSVMQASQRRGPADRLTVEALAMAIGARSIAQLAAPDGDVDAEIERWRSHSHGPSIARAIDYLETHLTESGLRIQDLACAAAMSSSHFATVFKVATGETPYAFILRRRAEFARDLIAGTREPLGQIAYTAGFSSQAHMSTVFRRVFGATPGALRR